MRLHRFHLEGKKIAEMKPSDRFPLEDRAVIHQWRDVFRYTVGSQILAFDDSKTECLCMIEEINDFKVTLVVLEIIRKEKEKKPKKTEKVQTAQKQKVADKIAKAKELWLIQSMLKGDNFEWIVEKTTELGVDHIVPVISERTIKKGVNLDRAKKIAIEASEQSGRVSIPSVENIVSLKSAVENFIGGAGNIFVCAQGGKLVEEILSKKITGDIAILVGPEGGWSPAESAYFKKLKLAHVSLGENTLRAETAAVCGVFNLKQYLGR